MATSKTLQIYQDLLKLTGDSKTETANSVQWLTQQANRSVAQMSPSRVIGNQQNQLVNQITVGHMYLFAYDPKTKDDLPYYDKFPLIFPFSRVDGGFYGINMHYLPPLLRAKLMDSLYSLAVSSTDDNQKLRLSYQILNSASQFKYFKPCVKHYLNSHVKSRFLWVPSQSWDRVLFLPLERFAKSNKQRVWRDSRRMVAE